MHTILSHGIQWVCPISSSPDTHPGHWALLSPIVPTAFQHLRAPMTIPSYLPPAGLWWAVWISSVPLWQPAAMIVHHEGKSCRKAPRKARCMQALCFGKFGKDSSFDFLMHPHRGRHYWVVTCNLSFANGAFDLYYSIFVLGAIKSSGASKSWFISKLSPEFCTAWKWNGLMCVRALVWLWQWGLHVHLYVSLQPCYKQDEGGMCGLGSCREIQQLRNEYCWAFPVPSLPEVPVRCDVVFQEPLEMDGLRLFLEVTLVS